MVALNQNAVKSLFWLKSENYLIGKPSHLLYTRPKRQSNIPLRGKLNFFTIFRHLSGAAAGRQEILWLHCGFCLD